MKTGAFDYEVSLEVTFTRAESRALVALAKNHYDATCVEAGLQIGEEHPKVGRAHVNGFLYQLLLRSSDKDDSVTVVWPFRNFDITAKILEMSHLSAQHELCRKLMTCMIAALRSINAEYKRLTAV